MASLCIFKHYVNGVGNSIERGRWLPSGKKVDPNKESLMRSSSNVICALLLLISLVYFAVPVRAEAPELITLGEGVPIGMLSRIFPIRAGKAAGTCFLVDVDQRQYLVTARHVVAGIKPESTVEIFRHGIWTPILFKPIFPKNEKIDAVAIGLDTALAPQLDLQVSTSGIVLGQRVVFLGFPFGLASRSKDKNDFIPFVKAGILSAIDYGDQQTPIVYVDGHNNPGFSGGPIIFANLGDKHRLQIAAVVSGYRNQPTEVVEVTVPDTTSSENGEDTSSETKRKKVQIVLENTGIVIGYQLNHLVEAIKENSLATNQTK